MNQAAGVPAAAPVALKHLVGDVVASQLVHTAGGLSKLAQLSESALRHLGYDELVPTFPVLRHIHAGFVAFCPIMTATFGESLDQDDHKTIAKVLELVGRKSLAAVKVDLAGDDAALVGSRLRTELEEAMQKSMTKGKSGADDDRALPAPDVRMATGDQARRGGRKAKAQKLLTAPSALEKAQAYVCMGVDIDEQRANLYSLREVRAEILQRRKLQAKRMQQGLQPTQGGQAKRSREEDEYKDLLQIRL